MMIDKQIIGLVPGSKRTIALNVLAQWCALLANIALMACIATILSRLLSRELTGELLVTVVIVACLALAMRFCCTLVASRMSHLSSCAVKKLLRKQIYEKLLRLGPSYREQIHSSEVVQATVEGVDQLETYFGAYLPQFFYAMLASLTLFAALCMVNVPAAVVLLVCVPLIPIAIAAVQTWAKKLLGDYWTQYTDLGDTFLENLEGLTTLKIYEADAQKNREMNEASERFRVVTMKVLTMQLNSITIMDLVAYFGAAAGMIVAITQYAQGAVDMSDALLVILLAADFFIPMRQLGSFFHIAMNGMAASQKIFRLLALPEEEAHTLSVPEDTTIACHNLCFSYTPEREVLHNVTMAMPRGSFTAIVGASGCGKSTIAGILCGRNRQYRGSVTIGGCELREISEESLSKTVTYVSHQSVIFKGSVGDNLRMAAPEATSEALWQVLREVRLDAFFAEAQGLDTPLLEGGANLSGGQRQRLALARAMLHDSPVYIFDEATSNIDVESENAIMPVMHRLAQTHTVMLISHRLANVVSADEIYVMKAGRVVAQGTHAMLLQTARAYQELWGAQQALEQFAKEGDEA